MLESLIVSTGVVALAEIGDKTQLLSLALAARYRKAWPICFGILAATGLNHALAGVLGAWLMSVIGPQIMRWVLGLSFIAMAGWALIPDRLEDDPSRRMSSLGVFSTTTIAFFLVEMGDKTQIATVALAAKYQDVAMVVIGTTIGMLLANVPVVVLGERFAERLPVRAVRIVAAGLFAGLGVAALILGTGS